MAKLIFFVSLIYITAIETNVNGGKLCGRGTGGGYGSGFGGSTKSTGICRGWPLTKSSIVGAKYYSKSQKAKASSRFVHWNNVHWDFDDWDRWRTEDGMLCRSGNDCTWLNEKLECDDYQIGWDTASDWFNGDTVNILGTCDCIEV